MDCAGWEPGATEAAVTSSRVEHPCSITNALIHPSCHRLPHFSQVRADELDVLVELLGWPVEAQAAISAQPAPTVLSFLSYPDTRAARFVNPMLLPTCCQRAATPPLLPFPKAASPPSSLLSSAPPSHRLGTHWLVAG